MAKNNTNGMNNALSYIGRRNLSPAHASSLSKLRRAARIAAGLRPIRMPKRRYFTVGIYHDLDASFRVEKAADLHFTKGFRIAAGVPLRISKIAA